MLHKMPQPILNAQQIQVTKNGSDKVSETGQLKSGTADVKEPSRGSAKRKQLPTAHVRVQI